MIHILAEGHGEVEAATKLVNKIWHNLQLGPTPIGPAIRWKNLHKDEGLRKGVEYIRRQNPSGLLIIRDDEDTCPANLAPVKAQYLSSLGATFPISYVIMYREFETLFVAYLNHFSGKTIQHVVRGSITFKPDINKPDNPEIYRDAKGFISNCIIGNVSYKPTTDQLTLTQALNINALRNEQLPCFGSLERGIQHIADNLGRPGIYPYIQ